MDTTAFFNYPTLAAAAPAADAAARVADGDLLPGATVADWDALLAATETLRFRPGDTVLRAGERDRALYLLLDGRLEGEGGGAGCAAPAALGVAAFLDGLPRAVTMLARTHGEVARLSWEAYEALAARDARVGRMVLADAGRLMAARVRAAGPALPGWTG